MRWRRLGIGVLAVATSSLLFTACATNGDRLAATCTYWASMAVDQEISQLIKVDSDGTTSVLELEAYGETGPSGRPIQGAARQSVTAQGSLLLYAPTSSHAGAFGEGWRLLDGDGNAIETLDWPEVESALLAPDGEHVAVTSYDEKDRMWTYGVLTLAGQVVWQREADTLTQPERWISDQEVWIRAIESGAALVVDLEGGVTDAAPVPPPSADGGPLAVTPSSDLKHYLGTNGQTVNLYDAELGVITHPEDAVAFSGLWITEDEFVYLRLDGTDDYIRGDAQQPSGAPDLVAMSTDDLQPVVVIENFGANPGGTDGESAYGYVHPESLIAACG